MKKTIAALLVVLAWIPFANAQQKKFTLSGYVKETGSSELMIGASIAIPALRTGTVSNHYGFYSVTLPEGIYEVLVTYVGYEPKAFHVNLNKNIEMDIILETAKALKEVVVSGNRQMQRIADDTRMSVIEIPIHQIKDIPALLGEKDVLKVLQLLPGVQKGGEGSAGIYVRGGGPDQNLIILDDAIVYNAYHLFGFFSLFNGDALKSVELTKGGFPARFGGRLSSVIDMSMKEGNKESFHGEGGIGIVASRLTFEGPIIKNKSSFIVSARRTYIDALTLPFQPSGVTAGYYFYDLNAKANYEINNKNRLYVSGYFGRDKFYAKFNPVNSQNSQDNGVGWGNATATLRWNHLYNNRTFANTSFIVSNYNFLISAEESQNTPAGKNTFTLNYSSGITDFSLKHDIDYRPNTNHTIRAGLQSIHHTFVPSALVIKDNFDPNHGVNHKSSIGSFENAVYFEDEVKIGPRFRISPGMRISHFNSQSTNYFKPEPRVSGLYKIRSSLSAKASYAVMNQYVHLLSNSGASLPTDLWVPATTNIKPKHSWQLAAGLAKDFVEQNFSASLEGYYKEMSNVIAYKDGASFLGLDDGSASGAGSFAWEQNITAGRSWSYGTELLIQKKTGVLTGWIGYTLSWTKMQFNELNFGQEFWAKYDRRHDIGIVVIYEMQTETERRNGVKLSATWVYGTGNAITLPVSSYQAPTPYPGGKGQNLFNSGEVSEYTPRNTFRMGNYHRADFGIQIRKKMKRYVRTWEFSVYNLYNRANPYFYYIDFDYIKQSRVLKQISLFPVIPSLSWNFKF